VTTLSFRINSLATIGIGGGEFTIMEKTKSKDFGIGCVPQKLKGEK